MSGDEEFLLYPLDTGEYRLALPAARSWVSPVKRLARVSRISSRSDARNVAGQKGLFARYSSNGLFRVGLIVPSALTGIVAFKRPYGAAGSQSTMVALD